MSVWRFLLRNRWKTWVLLALLAAGAGWGCLASELSNGFDLKSPRGFMGYLGGVAAESLCRFDAKTFDSCTLGP